jgi:hypothetical protein
VLYGHLPGPSRPRMPISRFVKNFRNGRGDCVILTRPSTPISHELTAC